MLQVGISLSQPQLCMAPVWGEHPISEVALVPHDFLAVQSASGGGQSAAMEKRTSKMKGRSHETC